MKYLSPKKFCREVVKLTPSGPLLGLSVSKKHVGLAISDVSKKVASPFRTLAWNQKDPHSIASELQSLISKHSISGLVVCHPFESHKRGLVQAELLVDDITEIGKLKDVNFTFWSESCTTKMLFKVMNKSPKKCPPGLAEFFSYRIKDEYAAFQALAEFVYLFDPRYQWKFMGFPE